MIFHVLLLGNNAPAAPQHVIAMRLVAASAQAHVALHKMETSSSSQQSSLGFDEGTMMSILNVFGQVLTQPYGSDPQLAYALANGMRALAQRLGCTVGAALRRASGERPR